MGIDMFAGGQNFCQLTVQYCDYYLWKMKTSLNSQIDNLDLIAWICGIIYIYDSKWHAQVIFFRLRPWLWLGQAKARP
jgi:hypothetical protein